LTGEGAIAGVDNGSQVSLEPFKANYRKAFHGLCLAIIQSKAKAGRIVLKATADGLAPASAAIDAR
jgi:beta-galactosidase